MTKTEMLAMLDKMAENIASIREALKADITAEWHEQHTCDLNAGSWHIIRIAPYTDVFNSYAFLAERSTKFSPNTGEWLPPYVIGLSTGGVGFQINWTYRRYSDSLEMAEQMLMELANDADGTIRRSYRPGE